MTASPKTVLLDRLLAEKRITAEQKQRVLAHVQANRGRVEDALIECNVLEEAALLKWLSTHYKTRFVSTEKLAKAELDRATLNLISRQLAEKLCVFPVLFDARDSTLAFVAADPENTEIAREIRLFANVPNVRPLIARPAAIRAAIQKHYVGDIHAFGKVDRSFQQLQDLMSTYERNVFDEESFGAGTGLKNVLPERGPASGAVEARGAGREQSRELHGATLVSMSPGGGGLREETIMDSSPLGSLREATLITEGPQGSLRGATIVQDGPPSGTTQLPKSAATPLRRTPPAAPQASKGRDEPETLPHQVSTPQGAAEGPGYASSIELVNVLVSLLENQRQELRGHSSQVARLMQKVGEHMGLEAGDVYALRLCGLLHELGKTSNYHLTALNVAEYEGHRTHARKCFLSPVRLFDAASLPKLCIEGLTHVYERFDGQGFPDRRAGKDIPLAARLLAIAETYADLTSNARNPFRKTLTAKGAVEVLGRYKDKIFDANLVDLFRVAALGEDMQSSLLNDRARILLVDADAEETTVLELRLVEQGCEVVLCRTAEQAYKLVQQGGIDAIITEVELKPNDGFTLIEYVRKHPQGADLPVLFLTRKSDRASVDRGFQLGAVDYIIKPAAPDVVVAKARNVLSKATQQRSARGVSGSLSEMPLPDVLQVLARTRKTGALRISAAGHAGEIQFGSGAIYNATFKGMRGPDAVYALLALSDGEFALDPSFVPSSRSIQESTENLLLEGMRRMDEATVMEGPARNDFSSTRIDES